MKTATFFTLTLIVIFYTNVVLFAQNDAKKIVKSLKQDFSFVPSGNAFVEGKEVSVQSFYMQNGEITNRQYLVFLNSLKSTGQLEKFKIAQIDTNQWVTSLGSMEAFKQYYHSHPAYLDYPVVNVSHAGALLYCEWLNENMGTVNGLPGVYKFRLPERAEYIRAARGDNPTVNYSWKNNFLRNSEGQIMCNFLQFGSENIHKNEETNKFEVLILDMDLGGVNGSADIVAPSESYWPNEFGIYNLNGNVAEMIVQDGIAVGGSWQNTGYDVRIESKSTYTNPNPITGFRVVMTFIPSEK
jgi:formylglycine-generating enzyme required for sulfatase activity